MKYLTVLFDGMADRPDENGQTPMSIASKPTTDKMAANSLVGMCQTVPPGMKPGSDVANLAAMGYNPAECYTGRSPLEALSIGIKLADTDVTYRCNLVTLMGEGEYESKTMADYSAGEITTVEAAKLIKYLQENLGGNGLDFYAGVSYRHCLKRENGKTGAILTPPHDISDRKITEYLPKGEYSDELLKLMKKSYGLLKNHPVNVARVKAGKNPANSIWLWGEGTKPKLNNFYERTGLKGAMISAVDLLKGIAIGAGMDSINVEGATGNINTNFAGKAQAAVEALKTHDYVFIHLEAPDECGHQGDKKGKIRSIELIDAMVVKPVTEYLKQTGEHYRVLIMPDHPTPYTIKTHSSEPVPFMIYDSSVNKNGVPSLTEKNAASTKVFYPCGEALIKEFLK